MKKGTLVKNGVIYSPCNNSVVPPFIVPPMLDYFKIEDENIENFVIFDESQSSTDAGTLVKNGIIYSPGKGKRGTLVKNGIDYSNPSIDGFHYDYEDHSGIYPEDYFTYYLDSETSICWITKVDFNAIGLDIYVPQIFVKKGKEYQVGIDNSV